MPHFRIHIKLEGEPLKEFLIEDGRRDVDLVYDDFKNRTYKKNGAGRVIYFDLVMIAEISLLHIDDRAEVINEAIAFTEKTTVPYKKAIGK